MPALNKLNKLRQDNKKVKNIKKCEEVKKETMKEEVKKETKEEVKEETKRR